MNELGKEHWIIDINDSQNFYNVLENKLINIVDRLVPFNEIKSNDRKYEASPHMKSLIMRKRA